MEASSDIFRISKEPLRARDLIDMAKERVKIVIPSIPKETPYVLLETYYEIAVQLITGIMYSDGFKTLNHISLIEYVSRYKEFSLEEIKILDQMRKFRHGTIYYGKKESGNFFINHEKEIISIINKLFIIAETKMPFVIIIRGPLGIGKTTISGELAKVLNAKIFHIDKILEEIKLDKVDEKLGYIPSVNFLKANKTITPQIKEILDNLGRVIIDGCFYHKEQLEDLKENLRNYKCYTFTLKAALETCTNRDSNRTKSYEKSAAEAVYKLVSKFDYGNVINSEGKNIKQVMNEILDGLK